jgi:hypothetical protein
MKVNYKINTLRGIFLCLTRNKYDPCSRHGFARKEFACFSASFRFFGWPCFTWQNQDRPRSSPLQKVEHFPICALYQLNEGKCYQKYKQRNFADLLANWKTYFGPVFFYRLLFDKNSVPNHHLFSTTQYNAINSIGETLSHFFYSKCKIVAYT